MIKSPLNYTGGKSKLLPQILPLFPSKINKFIDLFAGGCNVGINVEAKQLFFNDNLHPLVDMYHIFATKDIDFILQYIENRIQSFELSKTNVIGYNELRTAYNLDKNPLDLFVLIAHSFNHQIRFNNKHEFNISLGKNRSSYNDRMKKNLIAFVEKLKERNAIFTAKDFNDFELDGLGKDDFVYCDPPYLITTGSYNDGKRGFKGWTEKEEKELLLLLEQLHKKNINFALSNVLEHKGQTNQLLIDWLQNNPYLTPHPLSISYKNSNYQTTKEGSLEVLITNYTPAVLL